MSSSRPRGQLDVKRYLRIPALFHQAFLRVGEHDGLNLAQSCAYSALVSLFPALIVAAAVIGRLPDTTPIRFQLSVFFDRVLPPDVSPLLQSYFVDAPRNVRSSHALIFAAFVSVTGASGVIATLMEGIRRANDLPDDCWSFWRRRLRAYFLVPLSGIPFAIASLLVVFGHLIASRLAMHVTPSVHAPVYIVALLIRWFVALAGSTGIIGLIYHMGTPVQQSWKRVLPGAIAATAMWFLATLAFGWYVTRFANYSQVYGSVGAGIALLFWLYLISLSILSGAEFNTLFCALYLAPLPTVPTVNSPAHSPPQD
jgi:membrane protein